MSDHDYIWHVYIVTIVIAYVLAYNMRRMTDDTQAQQFRTQDEQNTQNRAAILGFRYFDTRGQVAGAELIPDELMISEMHSAQIIPLRIGRDDASYVFGVTVSTPQSYIRDFTKRYNDNGHAVEFVLISNSGFREFMLRYDPPKEVVYNDVEIAREGDSSTLDQVSKTLEGVRTDDILYYLIDQADQLGASDIHIENQRENVRIRLRVDGALHPIAHITHEKFRALLASIASKANISTAAADAQTGHMQQESTKKPGQLINMRIETIPAVYGMDAVIRLFTFDESMLDLDKLGMDETRRSEINEVISHPHGLVMVVGPTGSGKSTTLYSIMNALNEPSRKILTLEDPVEMSISGITQIPVNTAAGDSFADKLRAVMRLDPDVVLVGEIRDADTARTAIQASITGHLVLSTFHASTASAAFSRLIDMIGQNPIFANSIRMVIGQRLVRKLDDSTKVSYTPDEPTKQWIRDVLKDVPSHVDKPNLDDFQLWRPGESDDVPFGYKGRIMIMEQLLVTEEIQKYIRGEIHDVNVAEIEKTASSQGMVTILQDGVLKALHGETTLEEINRVI